MRIAGSVALVTGAGSGLGAATALHLASLGARVVGMDKDGEALRGALGGRPGCVPCTGDITDPSAVAAGVAAAEGIGALRVVVNCAATGLPPMRTVRRDGTPQPLGPWRDVVEANLVAAYDVMRQGAAAMARSDADAEGGRGLVVHTSSIAGLDGSLGVTAYGSSKAALASLAHSGARDLAVWGIRVVAVAPGAFDTPAYRALPAGVQERRERDMVFPCRPGRPAEFAAFVQHLVENDYLNATCFRLDGGLRMHD